MMSNKWKNRFLRLAREVSTWSKDPSTQVGCVLVRPDKTIASVGYNGPARGVEDSRLDDREWKLARTVHAELNAILNAHERLDGCLAFIFPLPPCSHCAAALIQAGIIEVYSWCPEGPKCWEASSECGDRQFSEAGVYIELITELRHV